MTVAAMQIALKKVCAQRSQRIEMRRQSLSLANMFSILWHAKSLAINYVTHDGVMQSPGASQ